MILIADTCVESVDHLTLPPLVVTTVLCGLSED